MCTKGSGAQSQHQVQVPSCFSAVTLVLQPMLFSPGARSPARDAGVLKADPFARNYCNDLGSMSFYESTLTDKIAKHQIRTLLQCLAKDVKGRSTAPLRDCMRHSLRGNATMVRPNSILELRNCLTESWACPFCGDFVAVVSAQLNNDNTTPC